MGTNTSAILSLSNYYQLHIRSEKTARSSRIAMRNTVKYKVFYLHRFVVSWGIVINCENRNSDLAVLNHVTFTGQLAISINSLI